MTILIDNRVANFTEAYNDYYVMGFSTVYAKLNNVDETKDICQEVFIRFYEKYAGIENHRKWLHGTLRKVIFEHYRKNKKAAAEAVVDDISMAFVNGFRDTRMIIEDALENIENFEDDNEKLLFDYIAIDNLSYAEAGKHLDMTEHQARYKYGILKDRIIRYLHKKGIESLEDLL